MGGALKGVSGGDFLKGDPGAEIVGNVFGQEAGQTASMIADPAGILDSPFNQLPTPPSIQGFLTEQIPLAIDKLTGAAQTATDLTSGATTSAVEGLSPFGGTQAFEERAALLGALGPRAQARALENIPVSEAAQAAERRQQERLLRGAAARGEFGSGATVEGLTNLGAAQQAARLQGRLSDLAPLADIERGVASTVSGLEEAGGVRQAQILAGLGPQIANIRLGSAAPIVQANTAAAELAGLQGIGQANLQAGLLSQAGQLAGQFVPDTFSTTPPLTGMNAPNVGPQPQTMNAPNVGPQLPFTPK